VEALQGVASPRAPSRKTGLSPIHVAAFFGEAGQKKRFIN
jgi:hypothetical protein